jgi:hypothetical protein
LEGIARKRENNGYKYYQATERVAAAVIQCSEIAK